MPNPQTEDFGLLIYLEVPNIILLTLVSFTIFLLDIIILLPSVMKSLKEDISIHIIIT
jgi:hypothetical protein